MSLPRKDDEVFPPSVDLLEDTETRLWKEAVVSLLERGAKPAEALEGASFAIAAWRRNHRDAAASDDEPLDPLETGPRRRPGT